jgi:hypothetical protein
MPSSIPSPLRISNIAFAFALIILTASTVYGVFQFRELQGKNKAIIDNETRFQEQSILLAEAKKTYQALADTYAKKQKDLGNKILNILPPDENYTDFTRQLDKYFADHDKPGNPIFQSSLRFGKGAADAKIPDVSMLPISMNVEATRDNFLKFLEFVSSSGSLENSTRMMDINSIQLNFPEGGEVVKDLSQKINFTVDMNAYYLTPKVAR